MERGLSKNAELAKRFANECKDSNVFYVMASGSLWASAYTMACCHLMEMQWKHAVPMHYGSRGDAVARAIGFTSLKGRKYKKLVQPPMKRGESVDVHFDV